MVFSDVHISYMYPESGNAFMIVIVRWATVWCAVAVEAHLRECLKLIQGREDGASSLRRTENVHFLKCGAMWSN